MALAQPKLAELKRYTFFVSRRLEDGRERFRLHMGYFDSLLQAEELLSVVRDIYPGAWAGEAPGKRLRARAAAVAAAQPVSPAPAVPPALAPPPPMPAAAAPVPVLATVPIAEPTLTLALAAEPAATVPTLTSAPTLTSTPAPTSTPTPTSAPPLKLAADPLTVGPPVLLGAAAEHPDRRANARGGRRDSDLPFEQRSNVREVLKSLDESARPALGLEESQVLRLLEEKRGDPLSTGSTTAAFAVQLQWSVQPIDLSRVPPLAIFSAYTLYTVEGNRERRRWYGLRLGFFTDAESAKQVAQYVRSEFASVAVVPVSLKERDGATVSGSASAPKPITERIPEKTAEFKLLEDTSERPKLAAAPAKPGAAAAPAAKVPAAGAKPPGRAGKSGTVARAATKGVKGRSNRVNAHEKHNPKTLEETLEILGADELQIEGAKRQLVSEGGIRHLDMKVQKSSALSRLLDRLAERKG